METKQKTLIPIKVSDRKPKENGIYLTNIGELHFRWGESLHGPTEAFYKIGTHQIESPEFWCEAAELYAGQFKQSEPVSLDVEQAFQKFNESFDYDKCLTKTGIDSSVAAKAGFIAGWQSQQPAFVTFFSDDQIAELVAEFEIEGQKAFRAFKNFQSELRKRVIDPIDFAVWFEDNVFVFGDEQKFGIVDQEGKPTPIKERKRFDRNEIIQIYLTYKTK